MLKIDKDSPVGLRLARRFWIELGRPQRFNNGKTMEEWAPKMESLFRKSGVDYTGFKWFLIWALRLPEPDGAKYGNEFTARNLRAAHDPMASLVKQFNMTFFEVFASKADKVVPRLIEKREQEEADKRRAASEIKPPKRVDTLPADAQHWQIENARFLDAQDQYDSANPVSKPKPGESTEDWVMRATAHLRDPDWQCPNCTYGVSLDGDDVRTKWCQDCAEERQTDIEDDMEWMCGEVETVSSLTRELD